MDTNTSLFLLDLHRTARRMPHAEFRSWVFDELSRVVQFDSALWYRWAAQAEASQLHAWYLYKQPESLIQEYASRQLWKDDIVYLKAVDAPRGRAVYASYGDYTSERMRSFLSRHQQYQVLTIADFQDIPQIASGLSLYRNDTRCAFSADDVATIETVAPHVVDAWRENWLDELLRTTSARSAPIEFSLAVLMPDMMMSEAQDNLGQLLHLEWPGWSGPWLPDALLDHVRRSREPWSGVAITVYQRPQPDGGLLILVRRRHPIDHLPPRKRAVALMFGHGASQSEVAHVLRLSTSTVNNYLGDIYQQLAIADKVHLAGLVNRLEP